MNLPPEVLRASAWLGGALLHSLWQGALLALVLAAALAFLRSSRPALRHVFVLLALAAMPAMTAGTLVLTRESAPPRPVHLENAETVPMDVAAVPEFDPGPATGSASAPELVVPSVPSFSDPPPFPVDAGWSVDWTCWLPAVWLAGVLALSLRHASGWWRMRGLRRSGQPPSGEIGEMFSDLLARLGLSAGAARLLVVEEACGPMLAGLARPVVLLPVRVVTGLPPRELEAILAHELAHLLRKDHWTNLLCLAAGTLYFYHPAVWWIVRCGHREREQATDDLVLELGPERKVYAAALANLAGFASAGLAANSGGLLARIERILRRPSARSRPRPSFLPAVATIVVAAAFLGTLAIGEEEKVVEFAPGETIQAAIDRAPTGATVRLPRGEFRERIEIAKPLTLEGVPGGGTVLSIEEPPLGNWKGRMREIQTMREAAATEEERYRLDLRFAREVRRPAILVAGADSVTLRQLTVEGTSPHGRGNGGTPSTLVCFFRSEGRMEQCTLSGPFGQGVRIARQSDVAIEDTLVAGFWGTGVAVLGPGRDSPLPASRLRLSDSEVRNCYYRCVTIGPGSDGTVVERCRISGSAWHGIRYNRAAPTIVNNAIYRNARSGIYAVGRSGGISATVRGNLFWANEMEGMSFWFDNADRIEGNTFLGNGREAAVVCGARPRFEKNVFAGQTVAIRRTGVRGENVPMGDPEVVDNLFWETEAPVRKDDSAPGWEDLPLPEGNRSADPQFVDTAARDFSLAPDSPARRYGLGAAEPLSPASPRPLLDGEKAIIPSGDTRELTYWTAPGEAKPSAPDARVEEAARAKSVEWVEDVFQLDDPSKREQALAAIRGALDGGDGEGARAGLMAFQRISSARLGFDRAAFRSPLRGLLESGNPDLRARASTALANTGPSDEDLQRVLALADDPDPDVRLALPRAIKNLSRDGFTGEAGNVVLALLDRGESDVTDAIWRAMSGTRISPQLEERVVAASRAVDGYSAVFYHALTAHLSKREPTITRLIELAWHENTENVGQRVLWGLPRGLAEDQRPRVAGLALRLIETRSGTMRERAVDCLRRTGSAADLPALAAILAKPGVTGRLRQSLGDVRKVLRGRG